MAAAAGALCWPRCCVSGLHPKLKTAYQSTTDAVITLLLLQNFPTISRKESLLDAYEYVMYGLVYKYQAEAASKDGGVKVSVFVSFGGLLMKLSGDPAKLNVLEVDSKVYLLMRKA
jgi:hypothetical protein